MVGLSIQFKFFLLWKMTNCGWPSGKLTKLTEGLKFISESYQLWHHLPVQKSTFKSHPWKIQIVKHSYSFHIVTFSIMISIYCSWHKNGNFGGILWKLQTTRKAQKTTHSLWPNKPNLTICTINTHKRKKWDFFCRIFQITEVLHPHNPSDMEGLTILHLREQD